MYPIIRFFLFLLPPETAHCLTLMGLKCLHKIGLLRFFIPAVKTTAPIQVFGLTFKNPVGIAAGLDKNGDYIDCLAALGVGFIEVGAVTPKAQLGNPKPRLFRLKSKQALINRMGFNNKGVDYLVRNLQQKKTSCIVGVNLGKNKETPLEQAQDDYLICLEKVYPYADFATVNISSPNTPGLKTLQTEGYLQHLLTVIKTARDVLCLKHGRYVPILVKIAPDLTQSEIVTICQTASAVKFDGIIATNTTAEREAVASLPSGNETGGLSGAPLKPLSFQVLTCLAGEATAKNLGIISVGGIDSPTEMSRRLEHGAQLVQIYTALIYQGPKLIRDCVQALAEVGG